MIIRLRQLYMLYFNGLIAQIFHFLELIHNKSTLHKEKIDDVLLHTTMNGILIDQKMQEKFKSRFMALTTN